MIKAPKIHTDLLWDLSFLFIGLGIVYFIAVFFYRNRLSSRGESVRQRKRELSPMISEFIFYEESDTKDEKSNYIQLKVEIRELLKDDFNRKILSEILLDLRKDVSGETQSRLLQLYQDLGLHNDAFAKLKSWQWQVVSKAILDLTQMQVAEAYGFITKFINDKRATIRKQAEIATVTLKYEGLNYFLDTTKYKISEWQQLKLLEVIRNQKDYQPPKFKAWLTSSNSYVVLFALRLIKFYNQNDAKASIIELVKHKNNQIKEEAIACVKEFHITEAIETLKIVFWKSSTDIKIAILDAIGCLGSENDIDFLQLIGRKESSFAVTSKALSSINAISPDSIMPSKGIQDTSKFVTSKDLLGAKESLPNTPIADKNQLESPKIANQQPFEDEKENTENSSNTAPLVALEADAPILNKADTLEEVIVDSALSKEKSMNLDFLPLVVKGNPNKNQYQPDLKADSVNIHSLEVIYEEVTTTISPKEDVFLEESHRWMQTPVQEDLSFGALDFLPIVIENEPSRAKGIDETLDNQETDDVHDINVTHELVTPQENPNSETVADGDSSYKQYNNASIFDIGTTYEEVLSNTNKINAISDIEVIDPCFLSSLPSDSEKNIMEFKSNANTDNLPSSVEMNPQEEAKFKEIINNLIDFDKEENLDEIVEEFEGSPLLEFENELIDISFIPFVSEAITESKEEESKKKVETPQIKKRQLDTVIPKSVLPEEPILQEWIPFEEDSEESTMQLLDDLTKLGDYREIPLLNEMLTSQKYASIKERVKKLIELFSIDAISRFLFLSISCS